MSEAQPQTVDVGQLPVEQLTNLREQLENEIQHPASSLEQLIRAANQYNDSNRCLESIKSGNEGKETLIPLTSSLYVPGKLGDSKSVMLDIGTGYFVERTPKQAQEYVKRKIDLLKSNIEDVRKAVAMKKRNFEVVSMVLRQKQQMAAQQTAQAAQS
eukprot:EC715684.1.p1 GENE.EC715684.1~~EC715684.1.p1  ORF type:complete len:157 (+),score=23.74 EC715684.1:1-471(+)